jgi:transglutaminase-like putative cysteine protease
MAFITRSVSGDSGGEDPLVRFLFETRSGFCEHFASAYAVMPAVGIPSLVVNGYAGGEWNSTATTS